MCCEIDHKTKKSAAKNALSRRVTPIRDDFGVSSRCTGKGICLFGCTCQASSLPIRCFAHTRRSTLCAIYSPRQLNLPKTLLAFPMSFFSMLPALPRSFFSMLPALLNRSDALHAQDATLVHSKWGIRGTPLTGWLGRIHTNITGTHHDNQQCCLQDSVSSSYGGAGAHCFEVLLAEALKWAMETPSMEERPVAQDCLALAASEPPPELAASSSSSLRSTSASSRETF